MAQALREITQPPGQGYLLGPMPGQRAEAFHQTMAELDFRAALDILKAMRAAYPGRGRALYAPPYSLNSEASRGFGKLPWVHVKCGAAPTGRLLEIQQTGP
jgi:hypothetical protein